MNFDEFRRIIRDENPWDAKRLGAEWCGKYISYDKTDCSEFCVYYIAEFIHAHRHELTCVTDYIQAIVRLKDGRWASWESVIEPTFGGGFSGSSGGGGDGIVMMSRSLEKSIMLGISRDYRKFIPESIWRGEQN